MPKQKEKKMDKYNEFLELCAEHNALITQKIAAAILEKSDTWVHRLVENGKITRINFAGGKYISLRDTLKYRKEHKENKPAGKLN